MALEYPENEKSYDKFSLTAKMIGRDLDCVWCEACMTFQVMKIGKNYDECIACKSKDVRHAFIHFEDCK